MGEFREFKKNIRGIRLFAAFALKNNCVVEKTLREGVCLPSLPSHVIITPWKILLPPAPAAA